MPNTLKKINIIVSNCSKFVLVSSLDVAFILQGTVTFLLENPAWTSEPVPTARIIPMVGPIFGPISTHSTFIAQTRMVQNQRRK